MKRTHQLLLFVALLSVGFGAGYWMHQPPVAASQLAAGKPLYYHCPMHPAYRSDKPGAAPCCGMELTPVYAEGAAPATPGAIQISVEKQQLMGLRTAKAVRRSGSHTLHALGRVAVDETRVHRVTAQVEGVVRQVSNYAAGSLVNKNELLAKYFVTTPELYSAIQSYFVAMNARDQGIALNPQGIVDASKAQLRLSEELLQSYGLTEGQIVELARTRQITRDIEFRSPVTGLILARNLSLGQRLERGGEVFRVADLTHVWVLADLFENESGQIGPGSAARVRYQGRIYRASVGDARLFDSASRTLKLRLDLDNAGLLLRPDMFVDVEFDVREPEGISVPVDSVLDSGRRKAVFVSTGPGAFEPREVTTGARYGDRVQIVKGLQGGENVVTSGLFLLDSESRLQLASAGADKPAQQAAPSKQTDPVCGMEVEVDKTTPRSVHKGKTYYFCSKNCKESFDKNPANYTEKGKP